MTPSRRATGPRGVAAAVPVVLLVGACSGGPAAPAPPAAPAAPQSMGQTFAVGPVPARPPRCWGAVPAYDAAPRTVTWGTPVDVAAAGGSVRVAVGSPVLVSYSAGAWGMPPGTDSIELRVPAASTSGSPSLHRDGLVMTDASGHACEFGRHAGAFDDIPGTAALSGSQVYNLRWWRPSGAQVSGLRVTYVDPTSKRPVVTWQ